MDGADAGLTVEGVEELAVALKDNESVDTVVFDMVGTMPVPLKVRHINFRIFSLWAQPVFSQVQDLNGNAEKQELVFAQVRMFRHDTCPDSCDRAARTGSVVTRVYLCSPANEQHCH